jgi:large subunit ribosomal protein L24
MAHIRKNDRVKVLSGKDRGRQGKVLRIINKKGSALVEGLNYVKRHTRAGGKVGRQGGIIEKESPLKLSKLMLVCPKCSKPTKSGIKILEDGSRVRYCRKCSEHLES